MLELQQFRDTSTYIAQTEGSRFSYVATGICGYSIRGRMTYRFLLKCAAVALIALVAPTPASAAKKGGVLRVYQYDSPASMSIHEEALNSAQNPIMAVFNNLVLFKQDVPQNRIDTSLPDLATKWSWDSNMTELTFQLRRGVSWHDGKPFTA